VRCGLEAMKRMVVRAPMTARNSNPFYDRLRALARWSAVRLETTAASLKDYASPARTGSQFVDLAPTDEADPDGVYARALEKATANPRVFNIALTGPYGSGKSSIIRTFLKRHPRSALHISLAAFLPEAGDPKREVSKQEIERSILQQLLYGADADKLPLSRFKRIKSPGFWSKFWSLYILLGFTALWYLFAERASVLSGVYFEPFALTNWFKLAVFGFAAIFLWTAFQYFYVASFGVSLKSISLKNVELSPSAADQASILNRHLDEIVYFFQSTKYKLVVVEDLDRFDNPDIFVSLREINSLVNGYAGVKRRVQFLYALRDDMFTNTDRTKFFEFIIPVVPIINSSNSIDMVLKQGTRLALEDRLDSRFLREVSRYLNDLRLISNIFNEYAIYNESLEADGDNSLDPNKLLAVLIYKNTYPRDFEKLHRGDGVLASIFDRKDVLIAEAERKYKTEIAQLEHEIQAAEQQVPKDLRDLRRIYAMALFQKLPSALISVGTSGNGMISAPQLTDSEAFDDIITAERVTYNSAQHGGGQRDIRDLQSGVDPKLSYRDRAALIEGKSQERREAAQKRIGELRARMTYVRTCKFNLLLRNDIDQLTETLGQLGDGGELARFLLLEGHLDDSYYQYTSMFHSGRLSPSDNKFLRHIRSFVTPDPEFPIDNAKEVIENMREDDFGLGYVLNVKIVDVLLSEPSQHGRKDKIFRFLATEFSECEGFFQAYYSTGTQIEKLLVGLSAAWPGLVPAVLESPICDIHLARLIEHAPAEVLGRVAGEHSELGRYLSGALPGILSHAEGLDPSKLEPLAIQVQDLSAIEHHHGIVRALFESGHYRLSVENLDFIYVSVLGQSDVESLHRRHFSTLRELNSRPLLERIGSEFGVYFDSVLCRLDRNDDESVSALLELLSHDELDAEKVEKFIDKQNAVFPSLEGVPERYHSSLFRLVKIEPSWTNCLAFLRDDAGKAESLIHFLTDDDARSALLKTPIPTGEDAFSLRRFLRNANGMPDDVYREYVAALRNKAKTIPTTLEPTKRRILVEECGVTFDADIFASLDGDMDLQVVFVANNIATYLDNPAAVSVDDDFRERLLRSNIEDRYKRNLIDLMDLNQLVGRPERAALVGQILARTDSKVKNITFEVAQEMILASSPTITKIKLLNELHQTMDVQQVRETLKLLPRPYKEITTGYGRPQLENSDENRTLAEWLTHRKVISSFGKAWWGDDIVINLYRK
jgi:hypothetical protein